MMRALFAGISGLRSHQTRMDVIGNNIANVNTVGYKASRATFEEAFVQVLRGASGSDTGRGGTNPIQVGTGAGLGSIDMLYSQGALESTGRPLDLAIQGDALFVLRGGDRQYYSRVGSFQLDGDGRLVSTFSGLVLQGVNLDASGTGMSGAVGDIRIGLEQKSPPHPTGEVRLAGNLDGGADEGATHSLTFTAYDSKGTAHVVRLDFTKDGPGTWSWTASCETAPFSPGTNGTITFNEDGTLAEFTYPDGDDKVSMGDGALQFQINPGSIGGLDGLTGYSKSSDALVDRQDGYPAGDLVNIDVDSGGNVNGYFSNGLTRVLARIALATFHNPAGLVRTGESEFSESANSGMASIGFAGEGDGTTLAPGALEGSNVDISTEFSSMIIAQRGFQANARVVSAADEMLGELVNIRR